MDNTQNQDKKTRIEIFKYNTILSALFFITSTLYLSGQLSNYSFSKYTISQMSYFLNPQQLSFFNLLFIIKGLLDLSFVFYVIKKFELKLNAITSLVWLIAAVSFGLIGFFPVNKFYVIHWVLAICLFVFYTIGEHVLAKFTGDRDFVIFTRNLIFIQIGATLFLIGFRQFNAIFEILYFLLAFFWQTFFISRYL